MSENDKSEGLINVESLKKERTNLRRQFTNACNKFDELNAEEETESKQISLSYNKILDKAERLFNIDNELRELIEHSEAEYDLIESYRDRFIEIKTIYEKSNETSSDNISVANTSPDINLKLPKLILKEYDLVPRTWVAFWGQFLRIHEDENIRDEDKFRYLLSSLKPKTKARDIVESYPPSKDNYNKAIDHLKSRFGRTDLLIEVYVRDLLSLVSNRSNIKLTELYDKLGSYLRALETLGVTTQNYAAMLYPVVESCLPIDVLKAWDRYRLNCQTELGDNLSVKEKLLEDLMKFLQHEVEGEEHRILAEKAFGNSFKNKIESNQSMQKYEPTASALVNSSPTSKKLECIFCDNNHLSQDCFKAVNLNKDERKALVIRKKCCLVCLKHGHYARSCRSTVRCIICQRRHYALLCPDLITSQECSAKNKLSEVKESSTLFSLEPSSHEIYLKTIMLRIRCKNKYLDVRALLDDGSHRSYIEKTLIQELKLSPCGREVLAQSLFGGGTTPEIEHGRYTVRVESINGNYSSNISFLDQTKICTNLPRIRDNKLLSELAGRGITLTDIGNDTPPIRILLGADNIGNLLTGRIEVMKNGISAVETLLGWTILGVGRKRNALNMVTLNLQSFEVPKIWDLETLGIFDPIQEKAKKTLDEETVLHFKKTLKVNKLNRYEVSLPWISEHLPLNDNYSIAVSRLNTITRRLNKDNIFKDYNEIFSNWEREGIIEAVKDTESDGLTYYLPHRPVIKLTSVTTKIRPVFDASSKVAGGASLNDCLSTGPSLLQQILPLLNRFRLNAIGLTADIKQAFLQMNVRSNDRNVLRFLWWKDQKQSTIKEYRHTRVVFGVTSSPFLLNATIAHHLDLERFQNEEMLSTVEILKSGFYVDNLLTSVHSIDDYENLKTQAQKIMILGKFDLRCWTYTGDEKDEEQYVLGLKWNTQTDKLQCVFPKAMKTDVQMGTKRQLLSVINSLYDPIGFTCPAMLLPKLILQEAWKRKLSWDDPLPNDLQSKYHNWMKYIDYIHQCFIPRRILHGSLENSTLHIFSDASANAYACCAYLRCETSEDIIVNLVAAKSRVAPLNRPTIPRMELLGALIASRLAKTILDSLKLYIKTYLWTDSMVVLAWILNKEPWNNFVGNRVKEIRDLVDSNNWRYVPGELNPADLPSRSCTWKDLSMNNWWKGPSWLKKSEELWPNETVTCPDEAFVERRKVIVGATNIQISENISQRFLYFSAYPKILRMMAWLLRFYENTRVKEKISTKYLTSEEIDRAEKAITKMIQREWSIENKKKYEKSMKFFEEEGLLKVRTRLILGNDENDFKCPTVLPEHVIVKRFIEHIHKSLNHAGVLTVLAHIRERFWIPRGRQIIRRVLSNCIACKRHSVKPLVTELAPLPPDRINIVSVFQVTGVDLAGPIFLRDNSKAWVVLFTCAVFRAIHLELVTSLSTEAFLQALRRFLARRGRSSVIYSDNGTNFTGTSRALHSLDWKKIESECGMKKIKWNHSPPSAPWYGGWWERMVRCIKDLLKRNLGRACLNYEEMLTVLIDCEDTINKRPLTYVSEDPNEPTPLTPAHFLQDIRISECSDTIDLDIIEGNHLRKRLRYVQKKREDLRKRFQREYLAELVRNPDNKKRKENIKVGDVVLVGNENVKRINWPLAKVTEIYTGKDGKQRVARLKLAKSDIIRPFQRLYPLEIDLSDKHVAARIDNSLVDFESSELDSNSREQNCGIVSKDAVDECDTKVIENSNNETELSNSVTYTRKGRAIVKPKKLDL